MKRVDPQDKAAIAAFAAQLKALRAQGPGLHGAASMQQRDAARRAGISSGQWSRLENGECDPSLTSMLRIQAAFGLDSIEALLGATPSRNLSFRAQSSGPAGDSVPPDST